MRVRFPSSARGERRLRLGVTPRRDWDHGGIAQRLEHWLVKPAIGVRFPVSPPSVRGGMVYTLVLETSFRKVWGFESLRAHHLVGETTLRSKDEIRRTVRARRTKILPRVWQKVFRMVQIAGRRTFSNVHEVRSSMGRVEEKKITVP